MAKTKSKKTAKKLPKCPVESDIEITEDQIDQLEDVLGDELYGGGILDAAVKVKISNKKKNSLDAGIVLYVLCDGDFGEDEDGNFDDGPHWIKFNIQDKYGFWYGSESDFFDEDEEAEDDSDWYVEEMTWFSTQIGQDVLPIFEWDIQTFVRNMYY